MPSQTALSEAVARNLFKLMAYKDEYEVARLYSDGAFRKQVAATFEAEGSEGKPLRYEFHLAPPLLARRDPNTGLPRKASFGPWMMSAFGVLAKLNELMMDIVGDQINLLELLNYGTVFTFAVVVGVLNMIVGTAFGAVGALIYNLLVRVLGGFQLGFTSN